VKAELPDVAVGVLVTVPVWRDPDWGTFVASPTDRFVLIRPRAGGRTRTDDLPLTTEDLSQVLTRAGPQVMAALRNLVISLHHLTGATNTVAALRHHARDARRPLQLLKIILLLPCGVPEVGLSS
jgi:hypothetical protein